MAEQQLMSPQDTRVAAMLKQDIVQQRFKEVLGQRSAAFVSSIVSAVNSNKDLKECEPLSVISAGMIAATLDLPVTPSLGFAHIVPRKGVAGFEMGWKGYVQLALRSGKYQTINATPILKGQLKKHNKFTGTMEFRDEAESDEEVGYLLYFRLINGYEKYFYMTAKECHAHGKKYSASYDSPKGKWKLDFPAMALKTVVKMGLSKYGILSIEMQKAVEVDQAVVDDKGNAISYPDGMDKSQQGEAGAGDAKEKKTTGSRASRIAEAKVVKPDPEETPLS